MNIKFSGDFFWESKVDLIINDLNNQRKYFEGKNYGTAIDEIFIVLVCCNPEYNFKQRIKFSKKDKILYVDIILDLEKFIAISHSEREKIVAEKLVDELPPIITKYKFKEFALLKFEEDLKRWLKKLKWT